MNYRVLGKTGWKVSDISFGAWAIGAEWGPVDDDDSMAALHKAVDMGINFFDTADVYGNGRSERLLSRLRRERAEEIVIATKAGRRLDPHTTPGYNRENLTAFVERSLRNLDTEMLDLLQLHCPPQAVYYIPETFGVLDDLIQAGKLRYYGVSVEKVEEALKAMEYPGVQTVQIIFNIFRQRPADMFFAEALRRRVGILARVPLASGLLTGRMTRETNFTGDDHRRRDSYIYGETFSGVDYNTGLDAVEALRSLVPEGMTLAQFALRWILMFEAVTCAIPGAKNPAQVEDNIQASDLPPLSDDTMRQVQTLYDERIKEQVHHYW